MPGTYAGARFSVLTDGHQTRIATRRSGVNAQRAFNHQTLQRNVGLALGQALNPNDRAGTLGNLLANAAQLVRMAVVQNGIEYHVVLVPVGYQFDPRLNFLRQTCEQCLADVGLWPYRRTAYSQYCGQLGQ